MTIVVSKVFQLTGLQSCQSPGYPHPTRVARCLSRDRRKQRLYFEAYLGRTVLWSTRLSKLLTTVTRKGQITIPAELRKKHGIREGMKVYITDAQSGILLKLIPVMNDWAGADAGKYTHKEMVEKLDRLRRR